MEIDADFIRSSIATVGALVATSIALYNFVYSSRTNLREEYKFAKEFICEVNKGDKMHPFVLEKGYQAIAGTYRVSSEEVEYILSLENTAKCLRDYVFSKKYVEHKSASGKLKIDFREKHRNKGFRKVRQLWYYLLYVFFGVLALSPLTYPQAFEVSGKNALMMLTISLSFFGFYAVWYLLDAMRIDTAERLVENQNKHTKLILVNNHAANKSLSHSAN